jgi:hypothetical protein
MSELFNLPYYEISKVSTIINDFNEITIVLQEELNRFNLGEKNGTKIIVTNKNEKLFYEVGTVIQEVNHLIRLSH